MSTTDDDSDIDGAVGALDGDGGSSAGGVGVGGVGGRDAFEYQSSTGGDLDYLEDQDDHDHDHDDDDDDQHDGPTLRQMAERACKPIDIGAAVLPGPLFKADVEDYDGSDELRDAVESMPETHYARVLKREFNAIVVEHHLKWAPLCQGDPVPGGGGGGGGSNSSPKSNHHHHTMTATSSSSLDPTSTENMKSTVHTNNTIATCLRRYDFQHADAIVDWAIANGITKIKGHVLVWHVTTPKILEELEPSQVRDELKRHIFTVMGHFRGRITMWDVVNEALAPDGSLAENVFYRKLGPSYIEEAFHWAHQADPDAFLIYNDNKVEGMGCSKKSEGFYELLADLKAKQVPVHGCGIQAHFNAAGTGRNRPPTPRQVQQQIKRLGKLGLKVNISEMDVRVSKLPSMELRPLAQRQIYHDILVAALSEPAFDGIWLWGFTDRHTWVANFYYDDEPLIFDEYYQRKPAYYGLRDAIASLTPGHVVGGVENMTTTSFPTVPLSSDADDNGNGWGHLWMQPDPEFMTSSSRDEQEEAGDAKPDWEQPSSTTIAMQDDDDNMNDAKKEQSNNLPEIS